MSMSSAGRAENTNGCVTRPKGREIGLRGFAAQIRLCSPTGSYVMATAEHQEPYESRGSRTVLGARGGEILPRDSTLRLDVGRPHHLAPLLGVVSDELAEICGRADKRRASKVGKPRLHLGIGEAGVDLLVEPIDDLGGRVPGHADAVPETRFVARHKLTDSRRVG